MECKLQRVVLNRQTFPRLLSFMYALCGGTFCPTVWRSGPQSKRRFRVFTPSHCRGTTLFQVQGVEWTVFRLLYKPLWHWIAACVIMPTAVDSTNPNLPAYAAKKRFPCTFRLVLMFEYISDMQTQNHVSGVNSATNWLNAQLFF